MYLFDQAAAARRSRAASEGQERDLVQSFRSNIKTVLEQLYTKTAAAGVLVVQGGLFSTVALNCNLQHGLLALQDVLAARGAQRHRRLQRRLRPAAGREGVGVLAPWTCALCFGEKGAYSVSRVAS